MLSLESLPHCREMAGCSGPIRGVWVSDAVTQCCCGATIQFANAARMRAARARGDVAALFFNRALTPDGWKRNVRLSIDDGTIGAVTPDSAPEPADERHAIGAARHAEPPQPRLPARHGGARRNPRAAGRQLLDLARGDVPLRADHDAGGRRGGRGPTLCRDAGGRLHPRRRVPLPASRSRRPRPMATSPRWRTASLRRQATPASG